MRARKPIINKFLKLWIRIFPLLQQVSRLPVFHFIHSLEAVFKVLSLILFSVNSKTLTMGPFGHGLILRV
jgi:hypothetical protein